MVKRFLVIVLVISIAISSILPQKAAAFLGIGDFGVFADPWHTLVSIGGWATEVGAWIKDHIAKVFLAKLRKELINYFQNKIVKWVEGDDTGGSLYPKDFKDFLKEASDQAAGDVIKNVGLGQFCDGFGEDRAKLQISLTPPPPVTISRGYSCTLSDVVDNVKAFKDNFSEGSFVGYQTLLESQNNRYGLTLTAVNELMIKKDDRVSAAMQSVTAGGGFLSGKTCLKWEEIMPPGVYGPSLAITENDPRFKGNTTPDGRPYNGSTERPAGSQYECTSSKIVTPGKTVGDALSKAVGSDIDFIMNAEDLSAFVAAITDAMIYRLTKEAGKGLSEMLGEDGTKPTIESIQEISNDYSADYGIGAMRREQLRAAEKTLRSLSGSANDAMTAWASAENKNRELLTTLNKLLTCLTGKKLKGEGEKTSGEIVEAQGQGTVSTNWNKNPTTIADNSIFASVVKNLLPGIINEIARIASSLTSNPDGTIVFNAEIGQLQERYIDTPKITTTDQVADLAEGLTSDLPNLLTAGLGAEAKVKGDLKYAQQRLDSCLGLGAAL